MAELMTPAMVSTMEAPTSTIRKTGGGRAGSSVAWSRCSMYRFSAARTRVAAGSPGKEKVMSALSARYLPMYAFGEITIVAPSSRVAGMSRCRGKAGGPAKYSLSVGGLLATTCCHLSKVTRGASDNLALLLGAARGTGGGPSAPACSARSRSSATLLLAAVGAVVARRWRTKLRIAV